jgi:hypothetical protein
MRSALAFGVFSAYQPALPGKAVTARLNCRALIHRPFA